jgi:hypothetical protein
MAFGPRKELAGQVFGKLRVIAATDQRDNGGRILWKCLCDPSIGGCGKETLASSKSLHSGHKKSCGCLRATYKSLGTYKHGDSKRGAIHKLYYVWDAMKRRCICPNNHKYKDYGARGIKVCKEWLDYVVFKSWALTNGYREGLSIDRIDNDGNYCPENCRWVTNKTQQNNKRTTRYVTVKGITRSVAEWCEIYNLKRKIVTNRLFLGWSDEDAILIPVISKK